jgi:predicted dinucleotide-binding enzyme
MKTAIIGLDPIGSCLARSLASAGEAILVADQDHSKARSFAAQCDGRARAAEVDEAIRRADIVILCMQFSEIQALLAVYYDRLYGKIIVDPSNPVAPDGKGGFVKIIPADESAGEIIGAMAPRSAMLVKAFSSIRAESMEAAANRKPEPAVMFYAADDLRAADAIAYVIAVAGFVPLHVGSIDQSIRIEAFGDLSEAGGLGRLVSFREGRALLKARQSR